MFKHHRYPKFIILQAVYFKFRFTLSYRDIEELMKIRGVKVDHSTIQRWMFKYAPMIEASMHKRKNRVCTSWRMDETYNKVAGKDRYLYRAVNRNNFWNKNIKIRRCKYLNNCVEQDHRNIKRRIAIDTGFKEFESAQRTLAGIEVVSIIRKNQIVDSKKSYFKTFLSLVA
jgi:putative transposase